MRAVLRITDVVGCMIHTQTMSLPRDRYFEPIHLSFRVDSDDVTRDLGLPDFGIRIDVTVESEV